MYSQSSVYFQAFLEDGLDVSLFFFSRRSRVRFVRIRVSTIISGLMSVEGLRSNMVRVPKMRHGGFLFFSRPTGLLQRSDNVM